LAKTCGNRDNLAVAELKNEKSVPDVYLSTTHWMKYLARPSIWNSVGCLFVLMIRGLRTGSIAIVPLVIVAFLSSCTIDNVVGGASPKLTSSWVKPDDPQEKLGKREHPLVLAKYGGAYSNRKAENLIAIVVGKLVGVSNDPSRVYKITILNSPKVNAFALPGGFLYVTRGLLALASDSSELAAVIAHEMAHVASNHAILRQERLSSDAIGQEIVNEVLGGSRAGKIALAANQIRLANFSRDQELQADTIGIRMIGNAGYDPFAAGRFLETMNRYQTLANRRQNKLGEGNFLSSHPTTPARVSLAKRHARFFGAPGFGEKARDRYLKGIDGILFGDTAEEGFVRGRKFVHGGLGVEFSVPKGYSIQNQPKSVIVTGPSQVATRFDATVLSAQRKLVPYLKSGWVNGLQNDTVTTETINGLPSATGVALSDGWRFRVRIIHNGNQLYRFITAGPSSNLQIDRVSKQIASSLRLLDKQEISQLSPLRIRVIEAPQSATLGSMARRMHSANNSLDLFQVLNSLGPGSRIEAGEKYKIVSE